MASQLLTCSAIFGKIMTAKEAFDAFSSDDEKKEFKEIPQNETDDFFEEVLTEKKNLFKIHTGLYSCEESNFIDVSDGIFIQHLYLCGFVYKSESHAREKIGEIFEKFAKLRHNDEGDSSKMYLLWDDELTQEEITLLTRKFY